MIKKLLDCDLWKSFTFVISWIQYKKNFFILKFTVKIDINWQLCMQKLENTRLRTVSLPFMLRRNWNATIARMIRQIRREQSAREMTISQKHEINEKVRWTRFWLKSPGGKTRVTLSPSPFYFCIFSCKFGRTFRVISKEFIKNVFPSENLFIHRDNFRGKFRRLPWNFVERTRCYLREETVNSSKKWRYFSTTEIVISRGNRYRPIRHVPL